MSLSDLIHKKRNGQVATATPATFATHQAAPARPVAGVATAAVAKPANDSSTKADSSLEEAMCSNSSNSSRSNCDFVPADVPDDLCAGALIHPSGGAYLPSGPYLAPDDVHRMRTELVAMIEALADLECWSDDLRDDVLRRAIRAPLSALLTDVHHFSERLTAARAEAAAREALDRRAWKMEGFDGRRGER
ncbi:hypothetical protein R69608_05135 [Paraburkholderia nemoris]|uniref:hypothetical protein n=1 Tax=Paraburkholderia nemoris TaxID=2793076 RepID=UPI001913A01D|nr:hypothetical protein [Paraburkholderia nemoris]MBK5149661.1 hypothetical protein [Burkholderia sp. R-69608]CAE6939097.1 hypothetical protein R69608_05135 [Paraburkholderia nemoris]